jgi:Tfp pilus assembly protein PilN
VKPKRVLFWQFVPPTLDLLSHKDSAASSSRATRNWGPMRDRQSRQVALPERLVGMLGKLRRAILPSDLFLPGLPKPLVVSLEVASLPADLTKLKIITTERRALVVKLGPEATLRRTISLPRAAASKAEAAIALQLRQTLPGQGRGLLWAAEQVGKSAGQVHYVVSIVKEMQIEQLIKDIGAAGGVLEEIVVGEGQPKPIWEARPRRSAGYKNWVAFTMLSVVVIASVVVVFLERERATLLEVLDARLTRIGVLEERLATARATAAEGSTQEQAIHAELLRFSSQARRLALLMDLADVLPDSVWISELSIEGDRMLLSGFVAGDVAETVSLLQGLPWAKEVQLIGPISLDSFSGQNRFEVGMRIATAGILE